MTAPKLDRWTKAEFLRRLDQWQRAETARVHDEMKAKLVAMATRRIQAEWGDPEKQAELRIVAKYCACGPITGANLSVVIPGDRDAYFRNSFGVEHDFGLWMPGGVTYVNRWSNLWRGYIRPEDPDYSEALPMAKKRDTWRARQEEQVAKLRQAFRETSSYRKIEALFPHLADAAQEQAA